MGYYDIDDILSDATKFPCRFNYSIPGLGYLEGNVGNPIQKNAKIELPLWLARVLAIIGANADEDSEDALPFLELMTPDMLSTRVMNAIKSNPVSLDVHSINSHFYALATKWATLFNDALLVKILNVMILERSQEINNHAASVSIDSMVKNDPGMFLLTLDESEKQLYKDSHISCKEMKQWMIRR
ncbi:LAFE_0G18910g1_1 [Lachancea fermentati]|uniref:DNA replication complex GINS protein PSF3 n=1 Tax=Lachancea fermentati TaxID=4955 RepID=A0A1G4MIY1_LACFM|nr:LAFE_0G18910g1_1 [Lachancea fermentati]